MGKINFVDKGEDGYEDYPINAENLNYIQEDLDYILPWEVVDEWDEESEE